MDVTEWNHILPLVVLEANSQINKSLKFSPFVCTFGREPRLTQDNVYKLPETEIGVNAEETLKIANINRWGEGGGCGNPKKTSPSLLF